MRNIKKNSPRTVFSSEGNDPSAHRVSGGQYPGPRGLTIDKAAAYVGLTTQGYRSAVRKGIYPGPMRDPITGKGTGRYDLRAIDVAMDRLSGFKPKRQGSNPYDLWKASLDEDQAGSH